MNSLSKSSSQGDSKGSKAPPSKHVSKGAEGTGSSFSGIASKMKNPFKKWSEGSKASSDSQQPSPNNENPETDTVPPPSKDANGKTTFQPKNLSIFSEEESQAWTISESSGDGTAEMLEVCWLDVTGSMTATKGKEYEISFILSMNKENSFGWEDPVYVMARIGEQGEYTRVQIDLSKLGPNKEKFPKEKYCRVKNAENNEKKLYFGLYEVWTNNWKGGLRIHEAIVQEIPDGNNASTSITHSDDSNVKVTEQDGLKRSTSEPLSKGKRYALSFKISMTKQDPVWKQGPVFMLAKVGKKGIAKWEKINLGDMRIGNIVEIPYEKLRFEVPKKAEDTRLYFGLYELWTGNWKQGLQIHEAVVEEMPD